VHKAK